MAHLDPKPYPMPTYSFDPKKANRDFAAIDREQAEVMKKLEAESDAALRSDSPVGFLLSFPVGDGSAIYRVSKTRPLTLQHVPYMDGYMIPSAHVRGITLADVKERMAQESAFKKAHPKFKPMW